VVLRTYPLREADLLVTLSPGQKAKCAAWRAPPRNPSGALAGHWSADVRTGVLRRPRGAGIVAVGCA